MFNLRHIVSLFGLLILALFVVGCASSVKRGSDDASLDDLALSRKLDLKDVDLALDKLMKELKGSPFLGSIKMSDARPGIAVDMIVNETDQHGISTSRLLESFETKIVNMGAFKVVSKENLAKFKQILLEQQSDWYEGGTVPDAGKRFGFRYIIGGKLFGETERLSGEARTQYRLVLRAMNVETGVIEWQDQVDVTKYQN